jgi:glycosyltransferase involved in cell wall biosynthesis
VKVRVLEVLPTLKPAGAENVAVSLACGLLPDAFRSAVVSLYDRFPGGLETNLEKRGIPVWHLGKRRGFDYRMWPRLRRVVREFAPHVVHTHSYTLRYVLAARSPSVIVHTAHNLAGHDPDRPTAWFNALAFSGGVPLVAVSTAVAESYRKMYGFSPRVIPNGIDVARFCKPEARLEWRRANGFSEIDVLVASVARLEPQKNPEGLVRAFANSTPGCHLLMAGDGQLRDSVRRLAEALGVAARVHILGQRADVPELLAASDVFALASHWEGNPLTVLEAMAARLPVVATAVGGGPEQVQDGVTGILVQPGAVQDLGEALASMARHPGLRRRMGEAAGARVALFSVDAMIRAYSELFERVAGRQV